VGFYVDDRERRDDWSLVEFLQILYRRKATLLGLICLAVLSAAAITAMQSRVYRSQASLEIQAFNDSFLDLRDVYPAVPASDPAVYMQTEVERLQQDALLAQVARKLGLEGRPEYRDARGLIPRLRQDIKIQPVRNSRIIQVVCDAQDPSLAAALANTLARDFIEQSTRTRQEAAWKTYQSLVPQLNDLRNTLRPYARSTNGAASPLGADVDRRFYDAVLEKAYHAWLAARLPSTNVRLVGSAEPPMIPHRPNWPLNLAIGAIGGLLLAVATVMLQEQHKSVLRVPGDAGTYLAVPELGVIPQARHASPFTIFVPGAGNGRLRVERAALEQGAGLAESFRTITASILSAGDRDGNARVLVVTSSQPAEGKTTVVSNLGIALAAISRKVLLIDGDLRRPRLHTLFDQPNSWGLSDVLSEKNAIDELPLDVLAKKTSIPHLYLLPSGASTDNVFGLLYSGRMARLLPRFREEFEYVLVDAPPCLEFADARILARHAEELLLVVQANHTPRRTAQAAIDRLRQDGIPLLGVILNRWDPAPGDQYSYRASRSSIQQGVA
jgi:receptor protein-tyrosine kinase